MARPSDREFTLKRKVKDLEEQLRKRDDEIVQLKKKLDKLEQPEVKPKKVVAKVKECPSCGAEIKLMELPHGKLELCSKGCGYRSVK